MGKKVLLKMTVVKQCNWTFDWKFKENLTQENYV